MNLKASLLKDKKITTEKLRQENKKMELRLQQLKLAMDKEKEERLSNGTQSNWSTGLPGALLNYKPNISGIDSGKKIRLKMLKEETAPSVRTTNLKSNILKDIAGGDSLLPKSDINIELNGFGRNIVLRSCGQCEENQAAVNCKECAEDYCPKCFAAFHLKGALRKHRSTPISTLNNRVSIPSPLFKPPDFKNISNSSSQSRIPSSREMIIKKTKSNDLNNIENKEDLIDNSKENLLPKYSSSSLADGEYNEELSNQYFQEAMYAWRNGIDLSEQAKFQQKLSTIEHSTETNSVDKNQKLLTDLIQFTPSLTYAEQLLLRKHRNNQLAPVDMKYILARLTKTNEKELLENQKLLQSNLVLETSLINSTTENALRNDQYHIDFESVNQLLNEAELINGRLTSMSNQGLLKSTFRVEEIPSPCDDQKIDKITEQIESVNKIEIQQKEFEKNVESNNSQTNNDNCEPLQIKLGSERSKSVINRNNFYDKPLSSRKLSARSHKGGNITSKPSVLLNILANLNSFLPLETDKISSNLSTNQANEKRPSSANVSISTNKISYNFYKLTPNSWKPAQAWSDEITNEKSNETYKYITNTSSTIDDQIDEEIKNEITKLNLLTNFRNNKDEDCPVSDRLSSSNSSIIGGNNYDMLKNVDADYYDEDSEKHEILDQLNTLERELTVLSKQEQELSQNNYDEIVADSLDVANDNDCINSMDSDKFCFEDSLDFQQRYSNNSNKMNLDYNINDDEEMLVVCSSRFDDYEDVYQLN